MPYQTSEEYFRDGLSVLPQTDSNYSLLAGLVVLAKEISQVQQQLADSRRILDSTSARLDSIERVLLRAD